MSNIKVIFNDENYSIDGNSISTAANALKNHLKLIEGLGAIINFDGVSYHVDSSKLIPTTTDLINYIKTITGNGFKVVVDGVKYNIDPTKVQKAISDLETYLKGLQNGENEPIINILLSLDGYILKDKIGLNLISKESK